MKRENSRQAASPETDSPRAYAGCASWCPHCRQDCTKTEGHSGSHRCPDGHVW